MTLNLSDKEWNQHKRDVQDSKEALLRIERAITGDPGMGIEGLANKVKRHDDYFRDLDVLKNKGKGIVIVASTLMSIVGIALWEVFKHIFWK
jgi:hypothetical protein